MSTFDCIMNYRQTILFLEGMYVRQNYLPDVRLGVEGQQDNECVEMFHTYIHTCDISCSVYRLIADCVFTFSR